MITLSLCMIVKNEADVLERCLESVREAVDEIIVVDTGSADGTEEIAGRYADCIYKYSWHDDFASARNYAMSKGTKDYLMWMDADDVLTEEGRKGLLRLKKELPAETDAVMMPYETAFDEEGNCTFSYYRERIVRKGAGFLFRGRVHEAMEVSGHIYYAEIPVRHRKEKPSDPERNLRIYRRMEESGEPMDARALYYYGRELVSHGEYEKAIRVFGQFFECPEAWTENKIDASRQAALCYERLGKGERRLEALVRTFCWDMPRGEVCCEIGRWFMEKGEYRTAAYWYTQALEARERIETIRKSGAFVTEECYGFLPAINLSVCFDRMGEREKAEEYNELAGTFRPFSEYYLANREYFRRVYSGIGAGSG